MGPGLRLKGEIDSKTMKPTISEIDELLFFSPLWATGIQRLLLRLKEIRKIV